MKIIDFKNANCKHCYKCVRSCSVKAIKVKDAQAQIMKEYCILCGKCLEVCPQNAKTFVSDLERVQYYIRSGERVVVSIAPSYLGIMDYETPGQVVDALLKLGFSAVRETAEGAALVTREYAKLLESGQMTNIITTCCPSVNDLIEKYYPSLVSFMAPVVSPMVAHGRLIKKIYGEDTKVVFLGPCVAKKEEAEEDDRTEGAIDAVIHFGELKEWMAAENIVLSACENRPMDNPDPKINRLYPVSHGVIQSVMVSGEKENYRHLFVDGIENCRELLEAMEAGEIQNCFIEMNMCEGGCIKGPATTKMEYSRYRARFHIEDQIEYAPAQTLECSKDVPMKKVFFSRKEMANMPTEEQIQEILKATGKYNRDQELNCGACGYTSCREKAIAVFQGKAELDMCLPHTFEQAKSMSNQILEATPNIIMVIRPDMTISEFNRKAQKVFHTPRQDAIDHFIYEFMDEAVFEEALKEHKPIIRRKATLEAFDLTVLISVVYMESLDALLTIIQDITSEEREMEHQYQLKMKTMEAAQKVIDKQMMVAQEIAGLLGETTAETKATLNKLKRSLIEDEI
ncbi:[Fe-Fe] hydrogenase large subunit C-terminal domain-containing protein [Frisingicoccus sp.]|uniref:[Fe-Fe] hydrogenase large subunit C-terminal domain-containing protein n=1 Tax=Frisingicoccus sp. TaxID=1918627 RepID=UPI002EC02FB2|nr:[Fe-Fe] hydrogenase large subunit C-terminal domain-containing protein [Frisingicoccus sp.]